MRASLSLLPRAFAAAVLAACGATLASADRSPDASTPEPDASTPEPDASPPDGSSCLDTTCDAQNCGRIGHDCLGGTCANGVCQPVLLADGIGGAEGLAVNATSVYVAGYYENRIFRLDKAKIGDCHGPSLPASCTFADSSNRVLNPTALAVDDTRLYFANTPRIPSGALWDIYACPLLGCGTPQSLLNAPADFPFPTGYGDPNIPLPVQLVLRDGLVFWPLSSALADGGGGVERYLDAPGFSPVAIAVDDGQIYFADTGRPLGKYGGPQGMAIRAVPRTGAASDGGAVITVADLAAYPGGIALAASGDLYWSVGYGPDAGSIQTTPKSSDGGATPRSLVTGLSGSSALIVDAANVYWVVPGDDEHASGLVEYCPLAGCPGGQPIVLAEHQRIPNHIAQDDSAIYWSNSGLWYPYVVLGIPYTPDASIPPEGGAPGSQPEGGAGPPAYDGQVWKIAKP